MTDVGVLYEQVMNRRRSELSDDALKARELFEQAYGLAMQVVELRERRGFTQAELARRCGINQGDISRIERGATSPTTRTLQRLASALDADLRLVARTA